MKVFGAATFALLLLAACGSTGGIFGTGNGNNNSNSNTHIRGTVDSVDTANHSIYLINAYNANGSMLSSGGSSGNQVRIQYDNNTTVQYQGRTYKAADLERGDQVDVYTNASNNNSLYASQITVTSDVRTSGTVPSNNYPYPSGNYPNNGYPTGTNNSTIHGVVRSVDASRGTLTLDPGYGSYITVQYNANTPVYWNGQTYQAGNLQIGDEIDVRGSNVNNGLFTASDMTVTRSVSSNGTYGTNNGTYGNTATLRGTVNSVDTNNHTIQLTQTNWIAGFDRNTGTSTGGTITINYNPSVQVNVNGQMYGINGLQKGDVIDVQLLNNGSSNYVANGITLVHDVNARY
ncbi:MAG TPA: DUF5666 domain-containing protein [Thermoanaerobaculia bacterium]|nr:DUF5666 domain-containing protein [Thermoanaerobaculia bacterium]